MKKQNIEVEGGEILLMSKEGHYAVIPAKHRQEVMDMVKDGCDDCINNYIQTLPKDSDYAEDGSLYPEEPIINPNNPIQLKEVTVTAEAPIWLKYKQAWEKENPFDVNKHVENRFNNPVGREAIERIDEKGWRKQLKQEGLRKRQQELDEATKMGLLYQRFNPQGKDDMFIADEQFQKRYGTSPHRYRYDNDPEYRKYYEQVAREATSKIDYPSTDLRRKDVVAPNNMWMYPNLTGESKKAMTDFSNEVIGMALPIPGLEAMGKIPSVFKGVKNITKAGSKIVSKTDDVVDVSKVGDKVMDANKTVTYYHGGLGDEIKTIDDIDLFRTSVKQNKKGRDYSGFYLYDESQKAGATKYAQDVKGGLHKLQLPQDAKIKELQNIERMTKADLQKYADDGYDLLVGTDVRGRTEYILLNKGKVSDFQKISINKPINKPTKIQGTANISKTLENEISQIDVNEIILEKIKHYRTPEFRDRVVKVLKNQGIDESKADDLIETAITKVSDKNNVNILTYGEYEKMADELVELSSKNPKLLAPGTTADDISSSIGFHIEPEDVIDKNLMDKIAVKWSSIERTKKVLSHEIGHKGQHAVVGKADDLTMKNFIGRNVDDMYINSFKEVDTRFSDLYKRLGKKKYSDITPDDYNKLKSLKGNSDAKDLADTFTYDELVKLSKQLPMFSVFVATPIISYNNQSQQINKTE